MNRSHMLYSLAEAPPAARWAVTLFLMTLGVAYLFGILMVTEWVGLRPSDVVRTFAEPDTSVAEGGAIVEERPIDLERVLGEEEVHRIDRRLLIQDTHIHVPVYAVIALVLAAIALGLEWPRRFDVAVVVGLFTGPVLDFAGQWLTKLAADGFAYLTLAGGWIMAGSYLVVAGAALWQMWVTGKRREI